MEWMRRSSGTGAPFYRNLQSLNMVTYTLALINNHEDGKLFFDTYNIPYQVITRGTNAGKLRIK